jgi:hypothetical protein
MPVIEGIFIFRTFTSRAFAILQISTAEPVTRTARAHLLLLLIVLSSLLLNLIVLHLVLLLLLLLREVVMRMVAALLLKANDRVVTYWVALVVVDVLDVGCMTVVPRNCQKLIIVFVC